MRRIAPIILLVFPVFNALAQNDSLLQNRYADSTVRKPTKADTSLRVSIYFQPGSCFPIGSFSESSTGFNNLGKALPGVHFKAGAEVFITPKHTISVDYDHSVFEVKNDSLNSYIRNNTREIYPGQVVNDISFPGYFQVVYKNFGLGISRLFWFRNFFLQTKLVVTVGSFNYDYLATMVITPPYSQTPPVYYPANYHVKDITVHGIRPEFNFRWIFMKRKHMAFALNGGAGLTYIKPVITVVEGATREKNLIATTDRVSAVNANLGISFILRKSSVN